LIEGPDCNSSLHRLLGSLAEFNDEPEGDGGSANQENAEPTNSATTLIVQQTSLCNNLGCSSAQSLKSIGIGGALLFEVALSPPPSGLSLN